MVFQLIETLLSLPLSLPFEIYSTFVIEERHGFNKYTAAKFASDKVKGFLVNTVLGLVMILPMIWLLDHFGDQAWSVDQF